MIPVKSSTVYYLLVCLLVVYGNGSKAGSKMYKKSKV